jgi:hypothetical protein
MSTNWDQLAEQYLELAGPPGTFQSGAELHSRNLAVRDFLGRVASALPKDSPAALSWFTAALQRDPQRWFVARVMSVAAPVPRTMLDPLLLAALLEPNPSANRVFVEPCVRTFGASEVASRIAALAGYPGVAEHGGVDKAMYWVPRAGA